MFEIKLGYDHLEDCITLIQEYNKELGVDLSFQNYEEEIKDLNHKYGSPKGRIYLCYVDSQLAGIICVHPIMENDCEMKRFYVRKEYRHLGIGRTLIEKLLEESKKIGYHYMYLDTLSTLTSANHLYQRYGFQEIPAYYYNPLKDVVYYRKEL